MKQLNRVVQIGLALACLASFFLLLATTRFGPRETGYFLFLFLVGLVAEWASVPLRNCWTPVAEVVYYAGMMLLGAPRGAILVFATMLGGYLAGTPRARGRLRFFIVFSNIALVFFPMLAAGICFEHFGSPDSLSSPPRTLLALAAMVLLYNAANNLLALAYLYLDRALRPKDVWQLNQLDQQFLNFLVLFPCLGLLLATLLRHAPLTVALLVPALVVARQAAARRSALMSHTRKTIEVLASAIDQRDVYTYDHSLRVSALAGALARHVGLPESQVEKIEWAAKIHDLGKVAILDSVLKKAGPLTDDEFRHMKLHPVAGALVAGKLGFCQEEAKMVYSHHEKYDGSGYPRGLKGEEIPLGARIISVADFFDALTSARVYRKPLSMEEVIPILETSKGKHFDPRVVNAFLDLMVRRPLSA